MKSSKWKLAVGIVIVFLSINSYAWYLILDNQVQMEFVEYLTEQNKKDLDEADSSIVMLEARQAFILQNSLLSAMNPYSLGTEDECDYINSRLETLYTMYQTFSVSDNDVFKNYIDEIKLANVGEKNLIADLDYIHFCLSTK